MLTYSLDKTIGTSLYEQLYGHIKEEITHGKLGAGEKLPSGQQEEATPAALGWRKGQGYSDPVGGPSAL